MIAPLSGKKRSNRILMDCPEVDSVNALVDYNGCVLTAEVGAEQTQCKLGSILWSDPKASWTSPGLSFAANSVCAAKRRGIVLKKMVCIEKIHKSV